MRVIPRWKKISRHPSVTLFLGDVRSGKTTGACSLIDFYHRQGLDIYMAADRSIVKKFPKWFKHTNPKKIKAKPNSVIFVDDAHQYFYARDWKEGHARLLDFIARARFHIGASIIYTTQQSRVLDVNLTGMVSTYVFKRPSRLQLKFERKEVRELFKVANEQLKTKNFNIKWAYIDSNAYEGLMKIKKPSWYTKAMSVAYSKTMFGDEGARFDGKKYKKALKPIIKTIKAIGRAVG